MFRKIILALISLLLISCSLLTLLSGKPGTVLPTAVPPVVIGTVDGTTPQACPTCPPNVCPPCPVETQVVTQPALPTETMIPTETLLPTSTFTAVPTNTNTPLPSATITTQPTLTPTDTIKPYVLHAGDPFYSQNFAHPESGCDWMGVVGQAFDLNGAPVPNLVPVVEGTLNGIPVEAVGLTGSSKPYGPGGYEIILSRKPLASSGTLVITLFGLDGNPLSAPIPFNTAVGCNNNLVTINFNQVR